MSRPDVGMRLTVAANHRKTEDPEAICRKIRNGVALENEDAAQLFRLRQIFFQCRKLSRRCGKSKKNAASWISVPQDKGILRQIKRGRGTANFLAANLLRLRHREPGCGISFSCAASSFDLPQDEMEMPQPSLRSRHRIRECRNLLCGAASQEKVAAQDFGLRQFL